MKWVEIRRDEWSGYDGLVHIAIVEAGRTGRWWWHVVTHRGLKLGCDWEMDVDAAKVEAEKCWTDRTPAVEGGGES